LAGFDFPQIIAAISETGIKEPYEDSGIMENSGSMEEPSTKEFMSEANPSHYSQSGEGYYHNPQAPELEMDTPPEEPPATILPVAVHNDESPTQSSSGNLSSQATPAEGLSQSVNQGGVSNSVGPNHEPGHPGTDPVDLYAGDPNGRQGSHLPIQDLNFGVKGAQQFMLKKGPF
jgi:hypothetical protein